MLKIKHCVSFVGKPVSAWKKFSVFPSGRELEQIADIKANAAYAFSCKKL
jgi:hypothetical protein